MQKRKKTYIFGFFISFFTAILTFGALIIQKVANIKPKNPQIVIDRERKNGFFNEEEFNSLPKKEVQIDSPFGYKIDAVLIEKFNNNKFMIFSHGVTENKLSSVKYMKIFLDLGYNAIIYDHRRHGKTGGKYTSYGHYEKYDLQAIVQWLIKEKGEDISLGIHGESMGAATAILYAGSLEDRADFYIFDCPFSNFGELYRHLTKTQTPFPFPIIKVLSDFFIPVSARYRIQDVAPINYIDQISKPALFIHSAEDTFIPPYMTIQLYEKKVGDKELYIAPHGKHAQSYPDNREEYIEKIKGFLNKYVNKNKVED